MYTEDVSKTNQGGISHRRRECKQVTHYANDVSPQRCLIRLYKLYMSECPVDCPHGAFYLKALSKPTQKYWYPKTPVGDNTLQQTVCRLCESVGFNGHFTNHSLRVISATRLFEANVDEQLIMQRTGHLSNAVREYKRVGQQLREETSDVLNTTSSIKGTATSDVLNATSRIKGTPGGKVGREDNKIIEQKEKNEEIDFDHVLPGVKFVGASNCNIYINYK